MLAALNELNQPYVKRTTMSDIAFKSAVELAQMIQQRDIGCLELLEHYLDLCTDTIRNSMPLSCWTKTVPGRRQKRLTQLSIAARLKVARMTDRASNSVVRSSIEARMSWTA